MDYRIALALVAASTVAVVLIFLTKPPKPPVVRQTQAPPVRNYGGGYEPSTRFNPGSTSTFVGGVSVGGAGTASGGNGGSGSWSVMIVADREPMTRKVMRAMGGDQPTNEQWATFFMRTQGGGCPTELYKRMMQAHEVAKRFDLTPIQP